MLVGLCSGSRSDAPGPQPEASRPPLHLSAPLTRKSGKIRSPCTYCSSPPVAEGRWRLCLAGGVKPELADV